MTAIHTRQYFYSSTDISHSSRCLALGPIECRGPGKLRGPGVGEEHSAGRELTPCSSSPLVTLTMQSKLEVKRPAGAPPAPANGLRAGGSFSGDGDRLSLRNAPPCGRVAG